MLEKIVHPMTINAREGEALNPKDHHCLEKGDLKSIDQQCFERRKLELYWYPDINAEDWGGFAELMLRDLPL